MDKKVEKLFKTIQSSYEPKRPVLKKHMARAGFFKYFFKERRAILKWNEQVDLIKPGFLGFSLKLHPSFKLKIDSIFVSYAFPIAVHLPQLLENGWQYNVLSIREFNLAVCFEDFCMKLESIRSERELAPKRFRVMEESFFRIVSDRKNVDLLVSGFRKMISQYKMKLYRSDSDVEAVLEKLARFFKPNGLCPSLYDMIVAYNQVETYRFLDFSDIMVQGSRETIPTGFYNCSIDVFAKIVKYLEGLVSDLGRLEKAKRKIEWLKAHIPARTTSPQTLISFYESLGHSWRTDSDDALLLILLLVDGIMGTLANALSEMWRVMDIDERIINIRLVSSDEMTGIMEEARREYDLARQKFSVIVPHPVMLDDYLETKAKEKTPTDENQAYVYKKIDSVFTLLRTLAEKLNEVYEKRTTNLAKVLNYMIVSPERWRGKPVSDIYMFYMDLILCSSGYFMEKKLLLELKEEKEIDKAIGNLQEKIKWTKDSNGIIIKTITSKEWSDPVAHE